MGQGMGGGGGGGSSMMSGMGQGGGSGSGSKDIMVPYQATEFNPTPFNNAQPVQNTNTGTGQNDAFLKLLMSMLNRNTEA